MQGMLTLLGDMREEGECIGENLEKQKQEMEELDEDIEDTKARLLQIKMKITMAALEFY